ncbi:MAG TPA: GTP-binding protein [Polyangiaceae bacterium]|nr:GTP-binding protein [Polyangiaceae bacterium]
MTPAPDPRTDIEGYLARHEQKELVRFVTIGSVDDGKSTLIGRILHDTNMVYDDQLAAVKKASAARGDEDIDFSLFTDGLVAEREQGITIDVAYRYFSTETRKFIIADTPGHVEYTRNMATGASTADIAVILLDARLGILPQSRRHAAIASLLGISQLVVAVNKMDLVAYDEHVFRELEKGFRAFLSSLRFDGASFVPTSAKRGDNVVAKSSKTPWYRGPTLLELLGTLPVRRAREDQPFRFPVQTVIRPNLDYRGFGGWVARGIVRAGDEVVVLPSGRTTTVAGIDTFEGSITHAVAPMSVTLRLADEVDVSRGELIAPVASPPVVTTDLDATVVWLGERPHDPTRKLLLKHTSRWVPARVASILGKLSLETLELAPASAIEMNDIVRVRLATTRPVFCDAYAESRGTGAFILVDALSNATVAAGMIEAARQSGARSRTGAVRAVERAERLGHKSALVRVAADVDLTRLERTLFERGIVAVSLGGPTAGLATIERLVSAGLVVLVGELAGDVARDLDATVEGQLVLDLRGETGDLADHVAAKVSLGDALAQGGGI